MPLSVLRLRALYLKGLYDHRACHLVGLANAKVQELYARPGLKRLRLGPLYLLEFIYLSILTKARTANPLGEHFLNKLP